MKEKPVLWTRYLLFSFVLFLLACDDNKKDVVDKIGDQSLSSEKINLLSSQIYSDPSFRTIEKIFIRRLMDKFSLTSTEEAGNLNALKSFTVGKTLGKEDSERFINIIGFKSAEELIGYYHSYNKLLAKYSASILTAKNAGNLEKLLSAKCLSSEYERSTQLFSLASEKLLSGKSARTMGNSPECYKCSFDYINCSQGYITGMYLDNYWSEITYGFGFKNQRYYIRFKSDNNSGPSINISFSITDSYYNVQVHSVSGAPTDSCVGLYGNCLYGNNCSNGSSIIEGLNEK
jgi:hypothetical protein